MTTIDKKQSKNEKAYLKNTTVSAVVKITTRMAFGALTRRGEIVTRRREIVTCRREIVIPKKNSAGGPYILPYITLYCDYCFFST